MKRKGPYAPIVGLIAGIILTARDLRGRNAQDAINITVKSITAYDMAQKKFIPDRAYILIGAGGGMAIHKGAVWSGFNKATPKNMNA